MTIDSLSAICSYFYSFSGIPFSCYSNNQLLFQFPCNKSYQKFIMYAENKSAFSNRTVSYVLLADSLQIGKINFSDAGSDCYLMIGAAGSTPCIDKSSFKILHDLHIKREDHEALTTFLLTLPVVGAIHFINILLLFNYLIHHVQLKFEDILDASQNPELSDVKGDLVLTSFWNHENQIFHSSYNVEKSILSCIKNGDLTSLLALLSKSSIDKDTLSLSDDLIRHYKNLFIALTTLVAREAINAGMNVEAAFLMSDKYIRACENTKTIDMVIGMNKDMLLEFISAVHLVKLPADITNLSTNCIQYINNHINEPISVESIANSLHMNRSYLSTLFKKELGFTMHDFITRRKIEEAKMLLSYTNKSLSDISNYLCFCNQSHFQRIFKKITGQTPLYYRLHATDRNTLDR